MISDRDDDFALGNDAEATAANDMASLRFELLRLKKMTDRSPVGIFHDDGKNTCIYVNDAWCSITGLLREEALGGGWMRVFHPDDVPWLIEKFGAARAANIDFAADYRIVLPDGTVRWVHGQSVPIIDAQGTLLGYAGTIHDITDRVELRKYLEDEIARRVFDLRCANENLRIFGALFDHALVSILLASPAGIVTHVNPAYEALFQLADSAIGHHFVDALRPLDATARNELLALSDHGDAGRCGVILRGATGAEISAGIDYHVIREGNDVVGSAVMVRDLTAEKQAEAERQSLELNLAASREALIRELSTPLMPVSKGVIVMPIVGSINDTRAHQIRETLLAGIERYDARIAVLDITGVKVIDTLAASALVSLARTAKLLGTRLFLSGIRAEVAHTIVELGAELDGMMTTSTLAAALARAIAAPTGPRKKHP